MPVLLYITVKILFLGDRHNYSTEFNSQWFERLRLSEYININKRIKKFKSIDDR